MQENLFFISGVSKDFMKYNQGTKRKYKSYKKNLKGTGECNHKKCILLPEFI